MAAARVRWNGRHRVRSNTQPDSGSYYNDPLRPIKVRNHALPIGLHLFLLVATHQVNVELMHTQRLQFFQATDLLFHPADDAITIHDLVGHKAPVVAAHLGVVQIVVFGEVFT